MKYIRLISDTLLQKDQNEEHIQKSQMYFFVLPNTNMNQHRQLKADSRLARPNNF